MPSADPEDIVVLTDDEGNEVEFLFLDAFESGGHRYAVLVPLEGTDNEDKDALEPEDEEFIEGNEAMIFRLEKDDEGEEVFVEIENDEEWAEVTAAWEELQDDDLDDEDAGEDDEEEDKEDKAPDPKGA